jgi:hypothetical protein
VRASKTIFLQYHLQQNNTTQSVVELAHDVCTTEPTYPENGSPILADFIKHCLLKSRDVRPQASHLLQVNQAGFVALYAKGRLRGARELT